MRDGNPYSRIPPDVNTIFLVLEVTMRDGNFGHPILKPRMETVVLEVTMRDGNANPNLCSYGA